VFESRVQRRRTGSKREMTEGRRKSTASQFVLFLKYYQIHQTEDEVDRVCSMKERDWKCVYHVGSAICTEMTTWDI
jgi:hypothetical protein